MTTMHTHHQAPRGATVKETTAMVATTALPSTTSTANAPARLCQGANAGCGEAKTTAVCWG
ncbi:hypothetical protein MKUB_03200 [Mycobacterium kubicae]|uniref:Uncharacterized protein n=1 Tax=Mycobacterium kubicae TaxID=120959 RepID=A0ABQ1BGJ1_9MYCO|nr:hypothetical protein MKUB_03200 [Mycobacterium kubicae]